MTYILAVITSHCFTSVVSDFIFEGMDCDGARAEIKHQDDGEDELEGIALISGEDEAEARTGGRGGVEE